MINAGKLQTIVALIALAYSGIAAAALIPTVNVLELDGSEFKAPAHEADLIEVQPCSSCATETVQVSGNTVYRLSGFNSKPVKLTELQRALRQRGGSAATLVYLAYDVGTLQVNEIVIEGSE